MPNIKNDKDSNMSPMQEHMMEHIADTFGEDVIVIFQGKSAVTELPGFQVVSRLPANLLIARLESAAERIKGGNRG